ncbi:MAG: elongation factor G [Actinobacteria bacterium]|nr:elongation factor G [Actinomycetota bacterium]
MNYPASKIRNVVVAGHSSCGKTTLLDAILFLTGATTRFGNPENGTSLLDFEPEEQSRKVSIRLSIAPVKYKDHKINFIDTPGYADFIGEVISGISAADACLIVLDASTGVQVQTDKVFHLAENLPTAFFINKLDKQDADFFEALNGLKEFYPDHHFAPITLPIGKGEKLEGVINLIDMKAYRNVEGKLEEFEIPSEYKDEAEKFREILMDSAAEGDDEILEKYLDTGELTQEELVKAFHKGFLKREVIPVFGGSGKHLCGLLALLEEIIEFFPRADEKQEITVIRDGEESTIDIGPSQDPIAYVFKTTADPYVGRLSFVRVFSGSIKPNTQLLNTFTQRKERIGHLYEVLGKEQREVPEIPFGDIGVIPKLAETLTGHTLATEKTNFQIKPPALPEAVYSVAVEPKSKGDEEKLSSSLQKLAEEDPTIKVTRDTESKQIIVSGLGDLQIDILLETMKRKFGVEATTAEPKIPYRETIKKPANAQGKYKRQSGGRGQYGDVWLKVEPMERGGGFEFIDQIVGGVVPRNYIPAVEKGVREAMEQGILAGFPVVDVRVTLYDGSHHPVDSSDMAFKIAGSMGFKNAASQANPTILEPIMKVEIIVPEKYMGDVMGQISAKRGRILGTEMMGKYEVIKALIPLAEMLHYATELRSITHGEGSFNMEFSHYDEVPQEIQQKIIEAYQKSKEEGNQR